MADTIKKKIVILGAGFGGIKAAFTLHKKLKALQLLSKYEIVIVDKNPYHTYTPTLYEIATTSKNLADMVRLQQIVTFPLPEVFSGKEITILSKAIARIDLINGDIHFDDPSKLKFDYLIIGLGSETNYFDIPGLKENSFTLKSFKDAVMIRDAIWNKVEEGLGNKELKIVIGGGGSTGIELAGEIKSWLCELNEDFKECPASVTIIEANPTVLTGFDERIIKKITRRLNQIEVRLLLRETIERMESGQAHLKSKKIVEYDVFIWTGGVKASSLTAGLPLRKEEKKGQVAVMAEMECLPQTKDLKLYGKVYGLGDAVCSYDPETNQPVPKVAEAAIAQAAVAAHNIIEEIKQVEGLTSRMRRKIYSPSKEFSYVIPVGGKYAVAKFGPFIVWGFAGWVLKGLVEFYYLLFNVLPPFKAINIWLKGLKIFIQNDRLG